MKGLWSNSMERIGGGWFFITLYTEGGREYQVTVPNKLITTVSNQYIKFSLTHCYSTVILCRDKTFVTLDTFKFYKEQKFKSRSSEVLSERGFTVIKSSIQIIGLVERKDTYVVLC